MSVVVPAFNAESFLTRCLDSVASQQLRPAEVIVVDDGSTDATPSVAKAHPLGVRYLHQANRGPSAARNVGISAASHGLVAFLDADDYWQPGFLARCAEFLALHSEAIAVSTGLEIRTAAGGVRQLPAGLGIGVSARNPRVIEDFFDFWASHDHVRTGSALLRRGALEAAGGFREDLRVAEDLELWGYLATLGKWGFIPEPLWVGNSELAAAGDWRRKYAERGRLCPSVEQWQRRLASRIEASQQAGFVRVRGRVAGSFAYMKILGGDRSGARQIVSTYGSEMPPSGVKSLLMTGDSLGAIGWNLACSAIAVRERAKAWRLGRLSDPTLLTRP